MEAKIKQLLQELGIAINESVSGSEDVNRSIQRIRDEGYDIYVVLDATVGLNRQDGLEAEPFTEANMVPAQSPQDPQFRINVNDLASLRALGIDPTRKVKSARRIKPLT